MSFTLDKIAPWGRSFSEYRRMFSLGHEDLHRRILGCADGPASFNAEATRQGARVVSCDPLYLFDTASIRNRIEDVYPEMMDQARQNQDEFIWAEFRSVEELGTARWRAMQRFLDDYEPGRAEGRYVVGALPSLPFPDDAFELTLCSHYLFLYTRQLNRDFHINAVKEMCRVSAEVRIFPLVALGSGISELVQPVAEALRDDSLRVEIEIVSYEFKRGANQMMRVFRARA